MEFYRFGQTAQIYGTRSKDMSTYVNSINAPVMNINMPDAFPP